MQNPHLNIITKTFGQIILTILILTGKKIAQKKKTFKFFQLFKLARKYLTVSVKISTDLQAALE